MKRCETCAAVLSRKRRFYCSDQCGASARQRYLRLKKCTDAKPIVAPSGDVYLDEAIERIRADYSDPEDAELAVARFRAERAKRDAESRDLDLFLTRFEIVFLRRSGDEPTAPEFPARRPYGSYVDAKKRVE